MTTLINLTPHPITIVGLQPIPPSGQIARVSTLPTQAVGTMDTAFGQIQIHAQRVYGQVVGLPDPQDGTAFIVSAMVADAVRASGRPTHDLFSPSDLLRDDQGQVVGTTGLIGH